MFSGGLKGRIGKKRVNSNNKKIGINPLDQGRKFKAHKTLKRRPEDVLGVF